MVECKVASIECKKGLRRRFECFLEINLDAFNLLHAAACLSDPCVYRILMLSEFSGLLQAAKMYVFDHSDSAHQSADPVERKETTVFSHYQQVRVRKAELLHQQ